MFENITINKIRKEKRLYITVSLENKQDSKTASEKPKKPKQFVSGRILGYDAMLAMLL